MIDPPSVLQWLVAQIRALLPEDWHGVAGARFREKAMAVSEFMKRNDLCGNNIAEEAVGLGRRKLHGLANKEYASALKDFNESEKTAIEAELQRKAFESKIRQEEAAARKAEADADLAELEVLRAN